MGIKGLHDLVKPMTVPVKINQLEPKEGCRVAVDAYIWLHKGARSCSRELCLGIPTKEHITHFKTFVKSLVESGLKPVFVFDGAKLPMKSELEKVRASKRSKHLALAEKFDREGKTVEAYKHYQQAVDISPLIANDLIQVLKKENIQFVVAPYEADAQMAYMAKTNQVDAVITEDSDLIPFGCDRIIFKLAKYKEVEFLALRQDKCEKLTGFTPQMILEMCILSGCDYLERLPKVGLVTARKMIKEYNSYDKVLEFWKSTGKKNVTPQYEESFKKAILTFKHQRVYKSDLEEIGHLTELLDNLGVEGDLDFLGPSMTHADAKAIAMGDLNPITKMPFEDSRNGENLAELGSNRAKRLKFSKHSLKIPARNRLITSFFPIEKPDHGTKRCLQSDIDEEMSSTTVTGLMADPSPGWMDLCKDKSPMNVSEVAFPEEPSKIIFALRLQGKVIDLEVGVAGADFKIKDDTGIINCHKWCASFKDAEYIDILLHVEKYEEDAHVYGALRGTQDDKLIEVMTVNRLQKFVDEFRRRMMEAGTADLSATE